MSYYQIIHGVRYDRSLIEAADAFTKGRGESRISLEEIQHLHRLALDTGKITDIEKRTLHYIAQAYSLTDSAKKWFTSENKLGSLDDSIQHLIREEFGLPNLRWKIDPIEVIGQQMGPTRDFISALRGALEAFLRWSQGQLSLAAVVSRRDLAYNDSPSKESILKSYLDQGTIYLIPRSAENRAGLEFDVPDAIDQENFWVFGLQIPDLSPVHFVAYVLRYKPGMHSEGYFSRQPEVEALIFKVIRQFAQYSTLEWQIDPTEVQHQLNIKPDQNFGDALFYAFHEGIYNGESSFSFRDFISQEIWVDPERTVQSYQREYIETGKLRLLARADDPAFPVPEKFWPGTEDAWVFGLEMPRKTTARFVITVDRDITYSSYNDGFYVETLPFQARIQHIISEEFKIQGLEWVFGNGHDPLAEFEAQRKQFGPEWRDFPSLFRQALNTVLYDYIQPKSVFNIVREVHQNEVSPENFDTAAAYHDAISSLILPYLKTGSIEFLPIEITDQHPVNGAVIQENWMFFMRLPALSDHAFFIIIQRHPDDGVLPYNYGVN